MAATSGKDSNKITLASVIARAARANRSQLASNRQLWTKDGLAQAYDECLS